MLSYNGIWSWVKLSWDFVFLSCCTSTWHLSLCWHKLCSHSSDHYHMLLVQHVYQSALEAWCVFMVQKAVLLWLPWPLGGKGFDRLQSKDWAPFPVFPLGMFNLESLAVNGSDSQLCNSHVAKTFVVSDALMILHVFCKFGCYEMWSFVRFQTLW